MARPWERLFISAARLCAWCVIATPFAIVAVLIAAALAGQQQPDVVFFLGNLVVQLFATLLVAVIGAGVGASIGIGTALLTGELTSANLGRGLGLAVNVLSAFPAVVLGWFGATLILPVVLGKQAGAVFAAAGAVVVVAVIPRAYMLAARSFAALPGSLREAAAAAGANPSRVAAHVTLPACATRITGIYLDAFSRAVGEAAAVTVVFLAAANAGYPVSLFTIPSSIMTHARSMQLVDASVAQSAFLILVLAAVSKTVAARRIGALQWV
jgi:ABC-type phosphate transport system permease subunit